MENREDLNSILPYLPLVIRSSSLYWAPCVVEALKAMSEGPSHSQVDSGEVLRQAISYMRRSLSLSTLEPFASHGYAFFKKLWTTIRAYNAEAGISYRWKVVSLSYQEMGLKR